MKDKTKLRRQMPKIRLHFHPPLQGIMIVYANSGQRNRDICYVCLPLSRFKDKGACLPSLPPFPPSFYHFF